MLRNLTLGLCGALLLSCAALDSNWHLVSSGYSIDADAAEGIAVEMHLNQLKQLEGEITGAEFQLYVEHRLKEHGLCPLGWQLLPCVEEGSCVQHTSRSVTVYGRCLEP